MVVDAIRGRWFEGRDAHRADALLDLARPDSATPAGPDSMIHVVVDYEALMRGHTVPGERCEIPGFGPIPVTLASQMSEDCNLKVLLTKGVDVMAVAHGGYMIPAHLRTALDVRDPKCIVPGCDAHRRLQKDHRNAFGRTGFPFKSKEYADSRSVDYTRVEVPNARWHEAHTFTCFAYPTYSESDMEQIGEAILKVIKAYEA